MARGVDTGDMICRKKIKINRTDNFEDVHDRLSAAGAQMLVETLKNIFECNVKTTKQYGKYATYAAKIEKEDCHIDFSKDALAVHNLIRGLSPIPLAYCMHEGRLLKVVKAEPSEIDHQGATPGTVISLDDGKITVACSSGCISFITVIPEGKPKMSAHDFILGRKIGLSDILL